MMSNSDDETLKQVKQTTPSEVRFADEVDARAVQQHHQRPIQLLLQSLQPPLTTSIRTPLISHYPKFFRVP